MAWFRRFGLAFLLAGVLAAGACDDATDDTTTPTEPTPTPVSVTETFTGTLAAEGSAIHLFKAAVQVGVGRVTTTLDSIEPDATVAIAFGVGTWDGTSCTIVIQNEGGTAGSYLVGTATTDIDLCVKAWDVGNVTAPVTYKLTVVHY